MRKKKPGAIRAAVVTVPLILSAAAYAQEASPPADASAGLEEITVTGSRIQRPTGFTAPTPVTIVGAERLEQRATVNIGDALNELPSFRASTNPATTQNTGGSIGARVLDLRGLGASRTLVLVDSKRFVASTSQGTIDTNLIPSSLVERVDIVTGGASAAYGSDAVAGVVNFALASKLEGIRTNVSYGESDAGDDENMSVSVAGGLPFAEGRGHFVAAAEYANEKGLGDCYTRDWCGSSVLNLGNAPPGSGGRPANNITDNVQTATYSQDGVINASKVTDAWFPLRGTAFTPAGGTRPFQYGELYGTNLAPLFMKGGEGQGENVFIDGYLLKAPVKRYIGYTKTTFDFTDTITGGLDVSYGQVEGKSYGTQYRDNAGNTSAQSFGAIKSGNPFIPTSVQQIMTAGNIPSFTLGRSFGDIGNALGESTTKTYRAVASLQGKFGDSSWGWDGYYQFGKNDIRLDVDGNVSISRIRNAIDATTNAAGQIVCSINAVTVVDPACAPFNPFGRNRFSDAAREYVTPHGFQTTAIRENIVAANTQGNLFALPAGDVKLAGGVEWRKQKLTGDADPVSKATDFYSLNGNSLAGEIEVKEGYVETNIPVLADLSFAKAVEINGAARRTHYSLSSPTSSDNSFSVTTWKAGATWEIIPAVRLRATKSRDIRAPNISELYGPTTTSGGGVIDPATSKQLNPQQLSGSNALLTAETADSWTAGIVLRPGGVLEGLQFSADYYNIQVDDAIGTLGGQTVAQRCFDGAVEFCPLVTRANPADPKSDIVLIRNVLLNVNSIITKGVDVEAQYQFEMGSAGNLDVRLLGTIVNDLITVDSAGSTQRAGMTGWRAGTQAGMPDWSGDLLTTWSRGPVSLTLHNKYIPSGQYNNSLIGPNEAGYRIDLVNSANVNEVDSAFYTDLSGQFKIKEDTLVVYAAINNLFDKDPPTAPSVAGNGNFILFDPIGRSYRVGLRAKF